MLARLLLRRRAVVVLLWAAHGCASASEAAEPPVVLEPARSVTTQAAQARLFDWMALPLAQGRRYHQYSTHDRAERVYGALDLHNKDFNTFFAVCGHRPESRDQTDLGGACDPGVEGYVIAADDAGPGFVSRIWFAWAGSGYSDERIRIFADDLTAPIYDAPIASWRDGSMEPFVDPLTRWTSNAIVSYVPIAYRSKLRIVVDDLKKNRLYYNHTNVQRGQDVGRGFVLQGPDELRALEERVHSGAGAEQVVDRSVELEPRVRKDLFVREGSGTISQLRFQFAAESAEDLRNLTLRMHWERSEQPAVELPLSAFFGAELELAEYRTLPLSAAVLDGELVLEANWPMPYFEHARISLESAGHAGRNIHVRVHEQRRAPPSDAGHFHASYRESHGPFEPGDRYQVAELRGAGKYVGTLMFMQGQADPDSIAKPHALAFLEGDERIVVDDVESVVGTGTEDYFDAGYYWKEGRFDAPFATLISQREEDERGSVTAARWHVLTNSIEFREALDFSFEYGADRPKTAEHYASVAYYYLFDE